MSTHILRKTLVSAPLFFYSFTSLCQTTFNTTVGGGGIDKTNTIISTPDKGFILAGETCNSVGGKGNTFLVKLNQSGQVVWVKAYGTLDDRESLNDIKFTRDNSLISVGERYLATSNGRGEVGVLLKTDASGNIKWWKEFDHQGNEAEGFSLQETTDQGFVIAGMMKDLEALSDPFFNLKAELQHLYVFKTDKDGVSQWAGYFSGAYSSKAQYVMQTKDHGYIVTGAVYKTQNGADTKICVLKLDEKGSLQWLKVYDNEGKKEETGMSIIETADNGYMLCGTTSDAGQGGEDIFLVKLNNKGDITWSKTYGGAKMDLAKSMLKLPDGGFVITGTTNSFGTKSNDAFLLKTDSKGEVQWFNTHGSSFYEMGLGLALAEDGFAVAGFNINSGVVDGFCIKTDANGKSSCSNDYALKAGTFPLKETAHEEIKWQYIKNTTMIKPADANASGGAAPVIAAKPICQPTTK